MATTPMFDPSGIVRQIPADQVAGALANHGKKAVKITDPTGTPRWIPAEQQDAALAAGGKLADAPAPTMTPATPPDTPDEGGRGILSDLNIGFGRGVDKSMAGAERLVRKVPVVGDFLGKHGLDAQLGHDEANAAMPSQNTAQGFGEGLETVAEFLTGEEALKGLSLGEKLTKIAPVLKQLEKYPRLAQVVSTALRQGTVGAGQASLRGATAGEAATTGAITGTVGGAAELALPAAYSGVKSLIAKLRPTTEEIAGETVPVLASQKPGAAPIASKAATTANAPAIAAAQQEGGQQAVTNIAQRAAKDSLDRVNAVRQTAPAITDPSRLLSAPEGARPFEFHIEGVPPTEEPIGDIAQTPAARYKQTGTRVVEGKGAASPKPSAPFDAGLYERLQPLVHPDVPEAATPPDTATVSHKEPIWEVRQYSNESAPGQTPAQDNATGAGRLTTTDPGLAQSTLTHLEDLHESAIFKNLPKEQQAQITAQRDSLQEQLGMYHAADRTRPHFDPVDTNAALAHVTSFGHAADQVEAAVKPIYQKLDEVSGGKFTALRNQVKAARKVMFQPGSVDAYEKALASKSEAEQGIQELFNRHSGDVSRTELQSANTAWRDASILSDIHATVEGAFRGAPKDISDTLGTNRIIRGNSLETRLNRLLKSTGTPGEQANARASVTRVIGQDGLENLYRVSDLLSKPDTAAETTNVARAIGMHLFQRTTRGAVIGGVLGHIIGHPFEGALAGAAVEDATRYVLRQAAIDPRVGMLVDRAVRHQVNPKIFAPLIAGEINSNIEPNQEGAQ